MDVTPLVRKGQQIIQSYNGGTFKVSGQVYEHAIVVSPDETYEWDVSCARDVNDLTEDHFSQFIEKSDYIDVLLLGTGAAIEFLPLNLRKSLKKQGVMIEMMDTGAACRTYNVLMAEGRRVVCALLPA